MGQPAKAPASDILDPATIAKAMKDKGLSGDEPWPGYSNGKKHIELDTETSEFQPVAGSISGTPNYDQLEARILAWIAQTFSIPLDLPYEEFMKQYADKQIGAVCHSGGLASGTHGVFGGQGNIGSIVPAGSFTLKKMTAQDQADWQPIVFAERQTLRFHDGMSITHVGGKIVEIDHGPAEQIPTKIEMTGTLTMDDPSAVIDWMNAQPVIHVAPQNVELTKKFVEEFKALMDASRPVYQAGPIFSQGSGRWDGRVHTPSAPPKRAFYPPAGGHVWRGLWNPSDQYTPDDLVTYNGAKYTAVAQNINVEPTGHDWSDTTWIMLSDVCAAHAPPFNAPQATDGLVTSPEPEQPATSGPSHGFFDGVPKRIDTKHFRY